MSKVFQLKGSKNFVEPGLMWNDRQEEEALLSLHFALLNFRLKRDLLRIMDPKLFSDGKVIDEKLSADDNLPRSNQFRQLPWRRQPTDLPTTVSYHWFFKGWHLKMNKVDLLTLLDFRNIGLLFLSETWLNPYLMMISVRYLELSMWWRERVAFMVLKVLLLLSVTIPPLPTFLI